MNNFVDHPRERPMPSLLMDNYQLRVADWMSAAFGKKESARSNPERADRFLEEALELYQACGNSRESALALVGYVFGRLQGSPVDEMGGVLMTLTALASCLQVPLPSTAEFGLMKCWRNIEKIRAKDASKPLFSPLPGDVL